MQRQTRHIEFLDYIRGLAVIGVFVFHSLGPAFKFHRFLWGPWLRELPHPSIRCLLAPITYGWIGVPVFFVVSGFCIHLSFTRKPEWKDFFTRRFFRIYPPYALAVLLFAVVLPSTRLNFHSGHDLVQLGSHLLLLHNFGNSTFYGINGSFWSIAVEVQLYLLYPILLWLVRRLGWQKAIYLTAVVEIALRSATYIFIKNIASDDLYERTPKILIGCPLCYWFSWSIGAYLAEEYIRGCELPFARFPCYTLALIAIFSDVVKPLAAFSFPLFSLLTAAMLAKLLAAETIEWKLPQSMLKRLRQTGIWSYSVYLLHQPMLNWIAYRMKSIWPILLHHATVTFILLLSTWLVVKPLSGLWYKFCELPGVSIGKRFTAKTAARGPRIYSV